MRPQGPRVDRSAQNRTGENLANSMPASDTRNAAGTDIAKLQGLRALVVEDSWNVGTAMKNLLRSVGVEVLGPVATTAAALRLVAETSPDVALVDVNLRGGELAYELIDRLHELGIRIVVTSGYAEIPRAVGKAAVI